MRPIENYDCPGIRTIERTETVPDSILDFDSGRGREFGCSGLVRDWTPRSHLLSARSWHVMTFLPPNER